MPVPPAPVAPAPAPAPVTRLVPAPAAVPSPAARTLGPAAGAAAPEADGSPRYRLSLAREQEDVRAAQRLRHQVFAAEFGARLDGPEPGLEGDAFDAYCDHVLVHDDSTGEVVGTYRLLPPDRARIAGRLYAESEFDLTRLAPLRDDLVEVGRSCVHPAHRNGAVISLIWAGIARYMSRTGHTWLAGCCSLPLGDGGALAAATWDTVRSKHLAPEEYWVTPHRLWTPDGAPAAEGPTPLPPLLRGYLRLGAWVCGAPAHDPDFRVADLYVLLSMSRIHTRYLRHFLSLA
ncbi:GNAT family N-acetyltransferase [Streptomyces sp. CC210A]|uniref:GNAT family N-acetyltransferase n=1 Tax=Streptomyces sp. CC210A TaxID=2898184 RepID=UPI001F27F010|nr:GNAT family N-acyltransferase [Streptomyces sp. CC210A]